MLSKRSIHGILYSSGQTQLLISLPKNSTLKKGTCCWTMAKTGKIPQNTQTKYRIVGFSTAIRMAMAETQLVKRTREFFLSNGVKLDAFSHSAAERSRVVIIVKNLSSQTTTDELRELFSRQGEVKDVLMPPGF